MMQLVERVYLDVHTICKVASVCHHSYSVLNVMLYSVLISLHFPNQAKKQLQEDAMSLLKSGLFKTVFDKALVLCQMHNFKDGVLYLYEQGRL